MNPSAVLKAIVAGSPGARVKKREGDVEAVDRKIEKTTAQAAELQKALDDGDGDAAAIVATAATLATARAERAVLVHALEAARQIVAQAEAEEERLQKAARVEELRAQLKTLRPEIEKQMEKFVELAGERESVRIQLENLGVREAALSTYVDEVNRRTSLKSGGRERDTMPLNTLLLIPVGKQNSKGERK